MELIDQHTKKIMEACKKNARDAGLSFQDETLEYIVTNRDMLELSPKHMIPTMYDYWVDDIEVLKKKGIYELYPSNPYETVINTRPAISYYNDNNPDWMNIMIFYHVLAHIDFFQNNILFEKTWNDDFTGQALADKRLISSLRSEHHRWVDYAIEFSRCVDNLVSYFDGMLKLHYNTAFDPSKKIAFYFGKFLQEIEKVPEHIIFNEVERYNKYLKNNKDVGESLFLADIIKKYPEFETKFSKSKEIPETKWIDLMEYIHDNSPFLQKEKNAWIKSVMQIVRKTSIYFQPQIRSKIINEGWASYWHDNLFIRDKRIKGHEVAYARINAGVTSISRVGMNPYAIGLRLIQYVEELANKGKLDFNFQKIQNTVIRDEYNKNTGKGQETIFKLREKFSDFMLIKTFVDQEFIDKHNLFVVGKRVNQQRGVYEYYVKSRKAEDYKKMLLDSLYHPPVITVNEEKTNDDNLYLIHHFEGKQLYKEFIPETLIGIEWLWGAQVQFETTEIFKKKQTQGNPVEYEHKKVLYTIKSKKVTKKYL